MKNATLIAPNNTHHEYDDGSYTLHHISDEGEWSEVVTVAPVANTRGSLFVAASMWGGACKYNPRYVIHTEGNVVVNPCCEFTDPIELHHTSLEAEVIAICKTILKQDHGIE